MYAELVCRSNYSFLEGASHPEELVFQAVQLGLSGLALTDGDGLYGSVKAHLAAREGGLKLVHGARVTLTDAPPVVVYVQDAEGYRHLCQVLSKSRLAHPKGEAGIGWRALAERSTGLLALLPFPDEPERVAPLAEAFPGRFYVGACRTLSAGDDARWERARALARTLELPLCARTTTSTPTRATASRCKTCSLPSATRPRWPAPAASCSPMPSGR